MGLLSLELAFLVLLTGSQEMSATCREREEHIQRYLISSQPPYDNYYNISKAVYPSVDLRPLDQDRRYVPTWQRQSHSLSHR